MARSASEFIIALRFARTRWRVSNHEAVVLILRDAAQARGSSEMRVWRAPDAAQREAVRR
jgi:hypothetical protein